MEQLDRPQEHAAERKRGMMMGCEEVKKPHFSMALSSIWMELMMALCLAPTKQIKMSSKCLTMLSCVFGFWELGDKVVFNITFWLSYL
jgi:hypothetical protein